MRLGAVCIVFLSLVGCGLKSSPHPQNYHQASLLIDRGVILLREGKLNRAESLFAAAYELYPFAAAIDGLGCVEYMRGHDANAEKLFKLAHLQDPSYGSSLANLALLYEKQGRIDESKRLYLESLAIDPKDFRARNNLAALLSDMESDHSLSYKEMLKAGAIVEHPLIEGNIRKLEVFHEEDRR